MRTTRWWRRAAATLLTIGLASGLAPLTATAPAGAAAGDVHTFTHADLQLAGGLSFDPIHGVVWFVSYFNDRIGKVTPDGTITIYADTESEIDGPKDTQFNPVDGNVWFTSQDNDRVGKLDPATGDITTYPAGVNAPTNLALGAGGSLWMSSADGIAQVSTSGVVTNHTQASIPNGVDYLEQGSDGDIWFTDFDDDRVGQITDAGTITTYALPSEMAGPVGITPGPDGRLWFIGAVHNRMARIDTNGTITVIPSANFGDVEPEGTMAFGADDAVWFWDGNDLARITQGLSVTSYPTSGNVSIGTGLSVGGDGNMWFGGGFTNKIGYLEPPGVAATHQLSVTTLGAGGGRVTLLGNDFCTAPDDCSAQVASGPTQIVAVPNPNATFAGWGGDCAAQGTTPSCNLDMSEDHSVTVTFNPSTPVTKRLTVTTAGGGSGRVTGGGIDCARPTSAAHRDCQENIVAGSTVTVHAAANAGSVFTGWSGACTGTADCTLTMSANRTATATFAPAQRLTVKVQGHGQVTGPNGIVCADEDSPCAYRYARGRQVTLGRAADAGYQFDHWAGGCTGTTCRVTLNADRTVTAVFVPVPPPNTRETSHSVNQANRKLTVRFTGSGGVGPLTFQCRIGHRGLFAAWEACTSPHVVLDHPTGDYTFQVRAVDSRGKKDASPVSFTYDV